MLKQLYANNAITTLATSLGPSDTSIQVVSAASFPKPGPNEYFRVTIDNGVDIEVIFVFDVVGDTFLNCVRGQEGTTPKNFLPGTEIECRVTRDTLAQFVRYQDRLDNITSVDQLLPPSESDGNSYLCASTDDAGNPIVVFRKDENTWRFANYTMPILEAIAEEDSTTTKVMLSGADGSVSMPFAGKYIIQFTSGSNRGLARAVTSSDSEGISWQTPLPVAPASGDSFEVYRSTASLISELQVRADEGLIYAILLSD